MGRTLDPISQDSCAFYEDHALYDDYGGVVVEVDEGARIAAALGKNKAAILQNHGLLTVADTVDAAAWWYIALERCCQVQLLAEAANNGSGKKLTMINETAAKQAYSIAGSPFAGWFQFQPFFGFH